MKKILNISLFKLLKLSILFISLSTVESFAQGYIDCSTIITDDERFYNIPFSKIQNGLTYITFGLEYNGVPPETLPVINGVNYVDDVDGYLAVWDSDCNQILGTFIGGSDLEDIKGIEVDAAGNIYIIGATYSTDFPTTDGTAIPTLGPEAAFLQKYAPDGTLLFSTLFVDVFFREIVVDGTDYYVFGNVGLTDFPTTDGTTLAGGAGDFDGFVTKYDENDDLVYSTLQGGSLNWEDNQNGVLVNGCLYHLGNTRSADFPTTDGSTFTGGYDGTLTKLDSLGNLVFRTVFGGGDDENNTIGLSHIVSDGTYIYISGRTKSSNFPTTDGSMAIGSTNNSYIRKYDLAGNLIYSKVLTGSNGATTRSLQIVNGNLHALFETSSSDFPTTGGTTPSGSIEAVIIKLDANGDIVYSTRYGGDTGAEVTDFFVNATEEVFLVTGTTNGPTTDGTNGTGITYVKFDTDGNLCRASIINNNFNFASTNCYEVVGDTLFSLFTTTGNARSTDGSAHYQDEDIIYTKFVFCPNPTTITSDILTPSTQTVCENGLVNQILGEELVIDGATFPPIYIDGILSDQPDIELDYQWQTSATASGPWTDIAGPLGQQQNYSPAPTTVDNYYRRIAKTGACCGGVIVSTSDVSSVLVNANAAPTVHAGGTFYTCPGNAITIGDSPAATGGTPGYMYDWNNGAFTTENPSVSPTQSTVYTLQVTDANGCIQAGQATVAVYTAAAGTDAAVCDGMGTTIGGDPLAGVPVVAAGDTPPVGVYSIEYDWSPKDGTLSCTDCPNPVATPSSSTDYTLTVTLNLPDGSSCPTTDMVNVGVVTRPATEMTIPDTVICLGDVIELGVLSGSPLAIYAPTAVTDQSATAYTVADFSDGDLSTGAQLPNGTANFLTIDLGSVVDITTIKMDAFSGDFLWRNNLLYSTDGVSFTQFHSISAFVNAINITFPVISAQYIRLQPSAGFTNPNLSEFSIELDYEYAWTPGTFIATNGSSATFDAGNLEMPAINPITYTFSASLSGCNFYDQVTVAVIEARADEDHCGPRTVGEPDRSPNIDETYSWVKITDPSITTGTGDFLNITNEVIVPVSASVGGDVGYELTTTFTLNGSTGICKDTVIVPPVCGPGCDIISEDGGCPDFDDGNPVLKGIPPNNDAPENWTYSWTSNEGMVGLDSYDTQIVNLTDNADRRYYVTFTSVIDPTFSCIDSIDANSAVYSTPVFTALSPVSVCPGDMISIGDPANSPGLTYEWSNGNYLDDPTISYPLATVPFSTEFTVIVTDNVTGCKVVDTVEVVTSDPAEAGQDLNVCDNGIVTIGGNTAIAGYTYAWEPAGADWRNGTDENSVMPDVFVTTTQKFILTLTDDTGTCTSMDSMTVTVEALPPSIVLPDLSYCPSQVADLVLGTDDGTTGGTNLIPNGFTYNWSPTGVSDITIQNPTVSTPLPSNSTTYTIIYQTPGGCNQKVSQTINPTVTAPLVAANRSMCVGDNFNIGDATNPTGGGITYSWNPTTDLSDATAPNPIFTPSAAGATTFTLTKTDGSCSATAQVTINVREATAPSLTPHTICAGETIQIGTTADNALSYQWTPTTDLDNPFIANPTFSGTSSTNYTLTVVNGNGCTAESVTSVTVNAAPPFTISVPDTLICDAIGSSLVFNANVSVAGDYAYNWTPSTNLSNSNELMPTFFIPAAGTYANILEVIDQTTGCSLFDTASILVILGTCDWGDLPDISNATAINDYQTTNANGGPVHIINPAITLGTTIDGEADGQPASNALGDGMDEDGLMIFESLNIRPGSIIRLPLSYNNTTGIPAHIEAWIDWNANGEFDAGEMVFDETDASAGTFDRLEVTVPTDAVAGEFLGLRIRISNRDNMTPYGLIDGGEVEDYLIGIDCENQVCIPINITIKR